MKRRIGRTETIENKQEKTPSQFLSQIYGNERLETDEAKEFHRVTLPEGIKRWAEANNLTEEEYFVIPVGSAHTLPDSKSDLDLVVILNTEDESIEDEDDYGKVNMASADIGEKGKVPIGIMWADKSSAFRKLRKERGPSSVRTHTDILRVPLAADLLFTPDELIYGNKELAQKMRLEALEYLEECTGDINDTWENGVVKNFKKHILGWHEKVDGNKPFYRNRGRRLNSLLERERKRLNERKEGLGDKWKQAFKEYIETVEVPSFSTFKKSLVASNGELSIGKNRFS